MGNLAATQRQVWALVTDALHGEHVRWTYAEGPALPSLARQLGLCPRSMAGGEGDSTLRALPHCSVGNVPEMILWHWGQRHHQGSTTRPCRYFLTELLELKGKASLRSLSCVLACSSGTVSLCFHTLDCLHQNPYLNLLTRTYCQRSLCR